MKKAQIVIEIESVNEIDLLKKLEILSRLTFQVDGVAKFSMMKSVNKYPPCFRCGGEIGEFTGVSSSAAHQPIGLGCKKCGQKERRRG